MADINQYRHQFKTMRLMLWSAILLSFVAFFLCVAKMCSTNKPRYTFYKPSTVFDNRTGVVYEFDDGYFVAFDVVGGKKEKRTFITNEDASHKYEFVDD